MRRLRSAGSAGSGGKSMMRRIEPPFFGGRMPLCAAMLSGASIGAGAASVRQTFTER